MRRQITSPANPLIKSIKKLKEKKERESTNSFYVEGIRAVGEAVRTRQDILQLIYCPALLDSAFGRQLVEDFGPDDDRVIEVSTEVFISFSLKEGPQGLAAVAAQRWDTLKSVEETGGLWTGLESIQDPGNLGTILRSSDAAGGKGVILLDNATDAYHPSSVRASTGAIFTQKLVKTGYEEFARWKTASGLALVGTVCGEADSYHGYNYPENMVLLMGSEQKGLPESYLALCDDTVTIPMAGQVDSLNVSVAASILLFEIYEQRKDKA